MVRWKPNFIQIMDERNWRKLFKPGQFDVFSAFVSDRIFVTSALEAWPHRALRCRSSARHVLTITKMILVILCSWVLDFLSAWLRSLSPHRVEGLSFIIPKWSHHILLSHPNFLWFYKNACIFLKGQLKGVEGESEWSSGLYHRSHLSLITFFWIFWNLAVTFFWS